MSVPINPGDYETYLVDPATKVTYISVYSHTEYKVIDVVFTLKTPEEAKTVIIRPSTGISKYQMLSDDTPLKQIARCVFKNLAVPANIAQKTKYKYAYFGALDLVRTTGAPNKAPDVTSVVLFHNTTVDPDKLPDAFS